jgi:hypothetical protein
MALMDPPVRPDRKALLDLQAETAMTAKSDLKVRKVHKDLLGRMDLTDLTDRRVRPGRQAHPELKVRKVPKDPLELTAATEPQVRLGPKVTPVPKGHKVKKGLPVVL